MENFWKSGRKPLIIMAAASVISYLFWRTAFTFNMESIISSTLFLLADYIMGFSLLSFVASLWDLKEPPPRIPPEENLKVDVWIPTYNEDLAILNRTIHHCVKMDYPHETYVLDDGDRPEVKSLAESLGARYIAREDNKHAKAGNLNNALKHTDGDFIAVFDADFIPKRNFLTRLLGYFQDPDMALVQAPQNYYNINSFQHRYRKLKKELWNEQSSFLDFVMRGRNKWNASFWLGTNTILRRKAIESVGGFAVDSVVEDMLTSMLMHAEKWKSIYIHEPLAHGLAPALSDQFLTQRLRWAQGATQIFRSNNPLFKKGLTFAQRFFYLASIFHFFEGIARLIYYTFPALYFLGRITPLKATDSIVSIMAGYVAFSVASLYILTRFKVSVVNNELYSMIRFLPYILGNLSGLTKRKLKFRVTPKSDDVKNSSLAMLGPGLILCLNLFAVIDKTSLLLKGGIYSPLFAFCFFWCLYYVYISAKALILCATYPRSTRFRVYNMVPLEVGYKGDFKNIKEICLSKSWGDSSINFWSRTRYSLNDKLAVKLNVGEGKTFSLNATIKKALSCKRFKGASFFDYEAVFADIDEKTKTELLDAALSASIDRQEKYSKHFLGSGFFPALISINGKVTMTSGRLTGKNSMTIKSPELLPAGKKISVAIPEKKECDFTIEKSVQLEKEVFLIGKMDKKESSIIKRYIYTLKKIERKVSVPSVLTAVSIALAIAIAANTSFVQLKLMFLTSRVSQLLSGTAIASSSSDIVAKHGHLRVKGGGLYDQHGNPVRLRGLSSHGPQWFPFEKGKTIRNSVKLFNVDIIRIAMYVEDFKNGQFWDGYLACPYYMIRHVENMLQDAVDEGIYVILSWHIHNDPMKFLKKAKDFFKNMSKAWGKYPNVLFEICNEPQEGISWQTIRKYAVGDPADPEDGVIDVIRNSDSDSNPNIIIVGTPFWSQWANVALEAPITEHGNIMYAFHFYAASHKEDVKAHANKAIAGGLPLFVSEWGTGGYTGGGKTDLDYSRKWVEWMDSHNLSWINWSLGNKDESTSILKPTVPISGPWKESDLTKSGKFIKNLLAP